MVADADASQQHEMALAGRLRLLWEQAHGSPAGEVHVLIGPDSMTAWLDDVLSLAERAVIKRSDGQQLVQRYAEQLLAVIQPELQAHVEAAAGRHAVASSIRADVDTGHVVCFFLLGGPLAPLPVPVTESLT
jgi:uncharacterized protein YbcI